MAASSFWGAGTFTGVSGAAASVTVAPASGARSRSVSAGDSFSPGEGGIVSSASVTLSAAIGGSTAGLAGVGAGGSGIATGAGAATGDVRVSGGGGGGGRTLRGGGSAVREGAAATCSTGALGSSAALARRAACAAARILSASPSSGATVSAASAYAIARSYSLLARLSVASSSWLCTRAATLPSVSISVVSGAGCREVAKNTIRTTHTTPPSATAIHLLRILDIWWADSTVPAPDPTLRTWPVAAAGAGPVTSADVALATVDCPEIRSRFARFRSANRSAAV